MNRTGRNVYLFPAKHHSSNSTDDHNDHSSVNSSPSPSLSRRPRNFSGSVHRPSSILTGLRELMGRPRSESMESTIKPKLLRSPINKQLIRVQIESCPVESVYDLREEDEQTELYNDSFAFRRPRSNSSDFLILRKTSRPLSVDVIGLVDDHADPYKQYMCVVDCYELAPHRGSIMILDKGVKLEKAFRALNETGIGAALVWSETEQRVVSILTLTDFLVSLLASTSSKTASAIETVADAVSCNTLVTLDVSRKLLYACEEFSSNHVHRIAVLEPNGDVLYLLTIKRILQAIHKQNRSLHFALWLNCEIGNVSIGTWNNIKSVKGDASLKDVAKMMLDYRISSVPIVDDEQRPIHVICKADIAHALADAKDIKECFEEYKAIDAVAYRNAPPFPSKKDMIGSVLDCMLAQRNCRCTFVKDDDHGDRLTAAISLSDFISYILYEKQCCTSKNSPKTT